MSEEQQKVTPGEIFDAISRLSGEGDWSEAELEAALREEGIDPDRLLKDVMPRVKMLVDKLAQETRAEHIVDTLVKEQADETPFDRAAVIGEISNSLESLANDDLRYLLEEINRRQRTR